MTIKIKISDEQAPAFLAALQTLLKTQKIEDPYKLSYPKTEEKKTTPSVAASSANTSATESTTNSDVTLEQVRAAVTAKAKTKREEVKALLTEFGVANVTSLEKDKYADFLTRINAL